MEARGYFGQVREAAIRLEQVNRLLLTQGEDWQPSRGGRSAISDPTSNRALRHIKAMEQLLFEQSELLSLITEARLVTRGVGAVLGVNHRLVLESYYIDHLTWNQVAMTICVPRRTCILFRDVALDWIDAHGFAHVKEGIGAAEEL